jgi:hypothetical protein
MEHLDDLACKQGAAQLRARDARVDLSASTRFDTARAFSRPAETRVVTARAFSRFAAAVLELS